MRRAETSSIVTVQEGARKKEIICSILFRRFSALVAAGRGGREEEEEVVPHLAGLLLNWKVFGKSQVPLWLRVTSFFPDRSKPVAQRPQGQELSEF